MCGGTIDGGAGLNAVQGLSPRVRGNHCTTGLSVRLSRSIPACAGEPDDPAGGSDDRGVYPRVCGGTSSAAHKQGIVGALSPRVRGNLIGGVIRDTAYRSIPACAGEPGAKGGTGPTPKVYPRVCGGTPSSLPTCSPWTGLSPRVRGNRARIWRRRPGSRSIPACAGEPICRAGTRQRRRVYPRVCGGTPLHQGWQPSSRGLSPRVRGNPGSGHLRASGAGSIPACAGEPRVGGGTRQLDAVYPRVCGGTRKSVALMPPAAGLSPRVRGNRGEGYRRPPTVRSIPACAGEPASVWLRNWRTSVYPRVCGGTITTSPGSLVRFGLSPRVRGNPPLAGHLARPVRSIPACAGEPIADIATRGAAAVYPRVCGGTPASGPALARRQGLSPRVRGNLVNVRLVGICGRSIPACAGEPPTGVWGRCRCAVYPRVCGGTNFCVRSVKSTIGLSPRVRGNPGAGQRERQSTGSIPACAGEPR